MNKTEIQRTITNLRKLQKLEEERINKNIPAGSIPDRVAIPALNRLEREQIESDKLFEGMIEKLEEMAAALPEVPKQTIECQFWPGQSATMIVSRMGKDERTATVFFRGRHRAATNLSPIGGGWRLVHYVQVNRRKNFPTSSGDDDAGEDAGVGIDG